MAREEKLPAGWFPQDDGRYRFWNGGAWTDHYAPNNNPRSPRGWFPEPFQTERTDLFRWWNGASWTDLLVAADGHHDLAASIGETIVTTSGLGGGDGVVVATLLDHLKNWPPVRIKTLHAYTSAVVAGTNLIATVEWDPPAGN